MTNQQIEIVKWWHAGRDYSTGVMLLAKYSKNKVLVHTLIKPGKENFGGRDKLGYELPKTAGLDWHKMPLPGKWATPPPAAPKAGNKAGENTGETDGADDFATERHTPPVSEKRIGEYPKTIRRLKYEYSSMYTQRSILHKRMADVPANNSGPGKLARAKLLAGIIATSGQMDYLYAFIAAWEEKGTIPPEEQVWPKPKAEAAVAPDTMEELKRRKKNLQTSNTKDRNLLLYQQKAKNEKEKPMQPGPKRSRIEIRMKGREKDIEGLEALIFEKEQGK